jgi:hypothetical protein
MSATGGEADIRGSRCLLWSDANGPIGDIERFEIPQRGSRLCYFICSEAGEGTEQ